MMKNRMICLCFIFGLLFLVPQQGFPISVDLELVLLIDVSGSISPSEFNLQKEGYVDAFSDPAVYEAISQGEIGSIAVTLVYFSGSSQQLQAVDWTLIDSYEDSLAFASSIDSTTRPFISIINRTAVQSALDFAADSIDINSNDYDATRQVIDISGDGVDNNSPSGLDGLSAALAVGYDTINGLVIGTDPSILIYYQDNVIGGTDYFVLQVDDFSDFGTAIKSKIITEVQPVPEPATMLFLGSGLFGLWGLRRKFRM